MSTPVYFDHLRAMTDHQGLFEHALLDAPRREHGYCVDDVARALIVVVREPTHTAPLSALTEIYLRFLEGAVCSDGRVRNRMNAEGEWTDQPATGDWWGRLLWAAGTTAARGATVEIRARALRVFDVAAHQKSADLRATAFAALGAAELMSVNLESANARSILVDLVSRVPLTAPGEWPWPERRLGYGNASIPEALIAAGAALGDSEAQERGLRLLRFLLAVETVDNRFSVTGTGGRGADEVRPSYDQQPIEIAALADACARAFAVTDDAEWVPPIARAWAWFTGRNDGNVVMFDRATGAGFDGLERDGRNENRGAESTLAALSTYQQAQRLGQVVYS